MFSVLPNTAHGTMKHADLKKVINISRCSPLPAEGCQKGGVGLIEQSIKQMTNTGSLFGICYPECREHVGKKDKKDKQNRIASGFYPGAY